MIINRTINKELEVTLNSSEHKVIILYIQR